MNTRTEPAGFDPERILPFLSGLRCRGRWVVAFSGGADSTALLLCLHLLRDRLPGPMLAVHVNHGVHDDALLWQQHCKQLCSDLDVEFLAMPVLVSGNSGEGLEAELRRLRYAAMSRHMKAEDVLLTAHHLEDQAETVLLHLARGSGPQGLAGMREVRRFEHARLARPLLGCSRESLREWLESRRVEWIEDPGNLDERQDRNFLRRQVLPLLRERWASIDKALARSAAHAREASGLLDDHADQWLAAGLSNPRVLDTSVLADGNAAQFKLVIRRWLSTQQADPIPGTRLEELQRQVTSARPDAAVSVSWGDWRLDLFHGRLWLRPARALPDCPEKGWDGRHALNLGLGLGTLSLLGPHSPGLPGGAQVGTRRAGDTIAIRQRGTRLRVKELFREAGIPPWLRPCVPMLRRDGEVLAVGDWMVSAELDEWLDSNRVQLSWSPAEPQLQQVRNECHQLRLATGGRLG